MSIRHEACQTCGTLLEYAHENAVVTCPACGTCNKLPDERVRDRADFRNARALQQRGDFLDAEASYQRVLDDIPDDADALWGRLLCHYGAALITDAGPQRRYTIRIPRSKPLRAQGDYERVLESAPAEMVGQYESDAAYIDLAMLRIKRLAETKAPYDIFICHKTTPLEGKGYTEDYARARDLRDLLVHKGYRVFFAPIDMEGVSAGEDYEAGIYHALNTARVMLVICSDPQHLQSTWVRSEWERYLTRVDDGKGAALIPLLYGGMKAGAMPRAYQIRNLQAIRMELDGKDRLLERLGQLFPRRMPVAAPVVAAPVVVPVAAKPAPAAAPVAAPAKPSDKPRKPVWPWVLLLCVVLALGGGVVLALQSGEKDDGAVRGLVPATAAPVVKTATPEPAPAVAEVVAEPEPAEVVEPEEGEVSPYPFALEVTPTPEPWTATPEPRTPTPVPKPNGNNELSSYGYVTERDVMFRTSASSYSTAIRSLQQYDMAVVLGTETVNGVTWYHVFYDGKEGYIQGKYFHQMTMGELEQFLGSAQDNQELAADGESMATEVTTATPTATPVPTLVEEDWPVGDYKIDAYSDGTCVITDYTGSADKLEVPQKLSGYTVTSIGDSAFYCCYSLTSITLPDSVTSTGDSAFAWCSSLTSITLPEGVTSIGDHAFYDCSSLTSIRLPDSVMSVGENPFSGCGKLTMIKVSPDHPALEVIDGVLFDKTEHRLICYPNALTAKSYVVPEGVMSIGYQAFAECSSLTSITLPEGLTSIGSEAFAVCSSLTSITLPDGVTSIGEYAFFDCFSLTSITLPHGVTSIGYDAFDACPNLTLVVPGGTYAENYAKEQELTYVIVGENGDQLSPPTATPVPTLVQKDKLVGDYKIDVYSNSTCVITDYTGKATTLVVPAKIDGKTVTGIGDRAFEDCNSLTNITLPEGVTSIGDYAFHWCTSLTSIKLPEGLTSIGDYAFFGCSLTSIELPEGVTSIGNGAFYLCESLMSITLPEGLTSLGENPFTLCNKLTEIKVSSNHPVFAVVDGVLFDKIEHRLICYLYAYQAKSYVVPDDVKSIGDYAFNECSSLTSITLPSSVMSIGDCAFQSCDSLTSIELPESVTSIGDYAFNGCSSLTSIDLPDSVTSIGKGAFQYCAKYLTLRVPRNSYAATYAQENNIPYEYID